MNLPDFVAFSEMALLLSVFANNRRANIMIVCTDTSFSAVLEQFRAVCRLPCHACQLPGPLDLRGCHTGTVLLHDVAELTVSQQIVLYDWMERAGRNVQVISVTRKPLASEVQEGRFLEGLFYRLNTLCLTTTWNA